MQFLKEVTMTKMLENMRRNMGEKRFRWYMDLPAFHPGMEIRCPMRNSDGTEIDDDDIPGCGSRNVSYDGDVYDCFDCSIFFCDYAADPPHRRDKEL